MLPMQSKVIQLPFENSASGFDLFSDGATALVPELTGFSGVDVITAPRRGKRRRSAAAGTSASRGHGSDHTTRELRLDRSQPPRQPRPTAFRVNRSPAARRASPTSSSSASTLACSTPRSSPAAGRRHSRSSAARSSTSKSPSNVIPTTTECHGDQSYVEIYVATPNGISNSILVPYDAGKTPTPRKHVAYDVADASQSIDVFYQWLTAPDQTTSLVASALPSVQ